jgi:hypothetical protein
LLVKVSTLTDKSVYPKRKERRPETEASFFLSIFSSP